MLKKQEAVQQRRMKQEATKKKMKQEFRKEKGWKKKMKKALEGKSLGGGGTV